MAPNFTPGADIAPAFRDPMKAAFPAVKPGQADVTGSLPMFEDEFTMMADGVMALRGTTLPTPESAIQTTGGIVHTHTPLQPDRTGPRWGILLGACGLLFAVGAGGAYWYVHQQAVEDPFAGAEPAIAPVAPTGPAAPTAGGAASGVIELDSVPGELAAPLGGGVGSGNVLSPAGNPPAPASSDGEVIEMKDGYLDVISTGNPAEVYLDGKWTGKTPLKAHALPAGTHVVQLIRGNKSLFAQNVEILEGQIVTVDLAATKKAE